MTPSVVRAQAMEGHGPNQYYLLLLEWTIRDLAMAPTSRVFFRFFSCWCNGLLPKTVSQSGDFVVFGRIYLGPTKVNAQSEENSDCSPVLTKADLEEKRRWSRDRSVVILQNRGKLCIFLEVHQNAG